MENLRTEQEIIALWEDDITQPMVSVCCTAFNNQSVIEDALKGFLFQETNFSFEILIHDDASTDLTAQIIKQYVYKYPTLIKPIYQNKNQYSQGRKPNQCFNFPRAKGKYIAFCEADDYWIDPLKLQKQVDFMEKNKAYGMIHTAYLNCTDKGEKSTPFGSGQNDMDGLVFEQLLIQNKIGTLTVVIRKHILDDAIQYYKRNEEITPCYDIFFWLYCSSFSKVAFMDLVTAEYRKVPGSVSNPSNIIHRAKFLVDISKIEFFFANNNKISSKTMKTVEVKFIKRLLNLSFLENDFKSFVKYFLTLFRMLKISRIDILYAVGMIIPIVYKIIRNKLYIIHQQKI